MPNEVELKFNLPQEAGARIEALPWLRLHQSEAVRRQTLLSVYFDTPTFKLRDNGVSLRIRQADGKRVQTVKAKGANAAFARAEWEMEVHGDRPDLKFAADNPLTALIGKKKKNKLRPVFETNVERASALVALPDSRVELALDRGTIRCGQFSESINEVELELKDGDPAGLLEVADRLAETIPIRWGVSSKAERGYALAEQRPKARAATAEEIVLAKKICAAESFAAIGLSCLRQVTLNEDAVRDGDAEGVHEMRVGLRRLRAAISLYKGVLDKNRAEPIENGLKWITNQLASARDLDVYLKETVAPLKKAKAGKNALAALETDLQARRSEGFAKAKRAIGSERYRQTILKAALWLGDRRSMDAGHIVRAQRSAKKFARAALTRRRKKIVKSARRLKDFDARGQHKLRIAVKKLRYGAEFFESLFLKARRRKAFDKTLKTLQDALGKLNDIAVHQRLVDPIVRQRDPRTKGAKKREIAFALGLVTGNEQASVKQLCAAAMEAGARLADLPVFWD